MNRFPVFLTPLLLIGFIMTLGNREVRAEESIEALVDSITANAWRSESENALQSFRIKSTSQMVNGDGDVKHEDISWQLVELRSDGSRTIHTTDEFGEPLPDEVPQELGADGRPVKQGKPDEDDEEKDEVTAQVGPLDPFQEENRANHRFTRLPDPAPGQTAIQTEVIDEETGGFEGTYIFDKTSWAPLSLTGHPVPLPDKKVKSMEMSIEYQLYGDGYSFPKRVVSDVTAKWLLFKFNAHMEQDFFDMIPREVETE